MLASLLALPDAPRLLSASLRGDALTLGLDGHAVRLEREHVLQSAVIRSGDSNRTAPTLDVFRGRVGDESGGGWVRATLKCDGDRRCAVDAALQLEGELFAINASSVLLDGEASPSTTVRASDQARNDADVAHSLGMVRAGERARRRRRLGIATPAQSLNSAAVPYARLSGCPSSGLYELTMGLVLDYGERRGLNPRPRLPSNPCPLSLTSRPRPRVARVGFVNVHGGRNGALLAAAEAVSRANAIFEDQLGVRVVVVWCDWGMGRVQSDESELFV